MQTITSKQRSAALRLKLWRENPIRFVKDNFKTEPDKWQIKALNAFAFGEGHNTFRVSLQACAGPGKSAVLAWVGWYFLSTQGHKGNHPKGAAVSVTWDNLKDNLWAELSKWQQLSPFLSDTFTWTKERIFAKDHPETWFLSARSWSKSSNADEQGRVLSGIHSDYVLFLIDESGEIPVSVLKAAEQALSNCKFGRIIQAGNPTSQEGMLYAAQKELAHLWHVIRITGDPEDEDRSPRIGLDWAVEQIKTYGRNDPWVMAYILGRFPESSINTLLSVDEVMDAMKRGVRKEDYEWSQKRLGVDVARYGLDSTILFPRQGLRAFKFVEMRGASNTEIAARILLAKKNWESELELVDGTGGFGAGVVDMLIQAGHNPMEIHFSSKSINPKYYNKRTEMWMNMAEWVKRNGSLPEDNDLKKELCSPTYTFKDGRLLLEPKENIKKRLGFSPDKADALALTFAIPELPKTDSIISRLNDQSNVGRAKTDYNPFD